MYFFIYCTHSYPLYKVKKKVFYVKQNCRIHPNPFYKVKKFNFKLFKQIIDVKRWPKKNPVFWATRPYLSELADPRLLFTKLPFFSLGSL